MKDFRGKVAVITGGASGVGRSLAFALGREGARIMIGDVDQQNMDDTVKALSAEGIEAIAHKADVSKADSMNAFAEKAFSHFGGVQLVFANAGIGAGEGGMMWEYNLNDWEWGFRVNVWGVINTINAFMPKLVAQNAEAHFVITGSGNGAFLMFPDQPVYTATKAAVHAITEGLYFQMRRQQSPVQVNALFPGPNVVETGIFNSDRVRPEDLPKDPNKPDSGITTVEDMRKMMEEYGMKLETTHPDEVAEYALEGLRENKFWISKTKDSTKQQMKARFDSIMSGTDPVEPHVS
ncbi:MAG: SDR family NAD(P)-dependent oxidoreductase [Pseudomonadales bacterium]|nr:SDR family NAD(P)-dependent oxidoreductase [Pseudomonadales bacterium]